MNYHTIEPFYNSNSKILILGSFPSVKSREIGFYYSHPQNRFWKIFEELFHESIISIEDKKAFLKKHNIALFDVCASCNIKASSDSSIRDVTPNNLDIIISGSKIEAIFFDGKTAYNLYQKFFKDKYNLPLIMLPSTSPANATYNLSKLVEEYKIIKKYIK